ncbi:hypothetical protein PR048_009062 [Dryococelus australis]|uniref:Uncharacterized protein n=1 Tax=Dryococelus australis TaxID=614101 RepID=A0ABQ9HYV4_9NEOP|nr:hypothetical protein PR048_009062 [Dryococelus australis]
MRFLPPEAEVDVYLEQSNIGNDDSLVTWHAEFFAYLPPVHQDQGNVFLAMLDVSLPTDGVAYCLRVWTILFSSMAIYTCPISSVVAYRVYTNNTIAVNLEICERDWSLQEELITLLKLLKAATNVLSSESRLVIPQQVASFLYPRYKDLRAEDETAYVVIPYVRQMVSEFSTNTIEDQLSDQSGDRNSDFVFIFYTPKQRSDGTFQFEHYLSEPHAGHHVGPLEWWKVREKS